ncbi:MAG: hypothetical protein L0Z50_01560 [Verrucomicrobiales bacterium]|nr:hypothetical protein [Verrucomicrobiales bacterium]
MKAPHPVAKKWDCWPVVMFAIVLSISALTGERASGAADLTRRGIAQTSMARPALFPHRIWAACDFEGQTPDYGWFGPVETNNIPKYPGNRVALTVCSRPYQKFSAVMTGINPVPGPRMGKENGLFLRYFLKGTSEATFQHFSLTREDNWYIKVSGLSTGKWSEVTLNFTRDARRNDGSSEPFEDGERMDDFKIFAGNPDEAAKYDLSIDDVIFFANDPALPSEPEPFPSRVVFLAAFDTGPKEKYWPGDFEIVETPPLGSYWRAARSVPTKDRKGQFISLQIAPPRPVSSHTKLRFRYHLTGSAAMTVQIFDATVQDNRHINLRDLKQKEWTTLYLDFSRDSKRNDGTTKSPFNAGNLVDDIFFFVTGPGSEEAALLIDEVVLYEADAGAL